MHIVFYRQTGDLFWCGEHRTEIDIEAEIGVGAGDHFRAAIVTILAHLGDQDPRSATIFREELFGLRNDGVELIGGFVGLVIALRNHPGDALAGNQIAVKSGFQRVGDLTERGANAGGVNGGQYYESNDAGWEDDGYGDTFDYEEEYYEDYDPWSDPGDGWGDYDDYSYDDEGWGDYFD